MCKKDIAKNTQGRAQIQRTQTSSSISSNASHVHLLANDYTSLASGDNIDVVIEDLESPQREDNGQSTVVELDEGQQVDVEMEQVASLPNNNE